MKLVQIILPLRDNENRRFERALYDRVHRELGDEFGGLTAYTRSPARGVWRSLGKEKREDVVIIEVMSDRARRAWWTRYRRKLERRFRQKELIVRMQNFVKL
jgi:hypothetical protein